MPCMDENKHHRPFIAPIPLLFAFAVSLVLAIYVGVYVLLVTPPGRRGLLGVYGRYRIGEPFTPILFYPLEKLDRQIRPQKWIEPRKE